MFSLLYETVTDAGWPFPDGIDVTLRQFVGYCLDIGTALSSMYGERPRAIQVESIGRCDGSNLWFEMLVPSQFESVITNGVDGAEPPISGDNAEPETEATWFEALHVPAFRFNEDIAILRWGRRPISGRRYEVVKSDLTTDITRAFKGQTEVFVFDNDHRWLYVPKIEISGHTIPWHPLLSDYLFAFVLGSVVRYQPFLVTPAEKSYALGESWCRQAPVTALRYFLMRLTTKPMRIKSIA